MVQASWPLELIPQGLFIDGGSGCGDGGGNELRSVFFYYSSITNSFQMPTESNALCDT
jgi:hypothetical protein